MTDAVPPSVSHPLGRPSGPAPTAPLYGEELSLEEQAGPPRTYLLRFTGQTEDYFRIWIVNLALSIVTLGLFLPWAKVRQRAYLYGHTQLDGHGFEYTADPKALLRGYLLMGGLFALANLSLNFADSDPRLLWIALPLFLAFTLLYPWLMMKSLRFAAYNSRYRNLRFHFSGKPGGAYMAYMLGNIVASLTGGLATPWAWYMQRDYQLSNLSYGRTPFRFDGDVGDFFLIGLRAAAFMVVGAVVTFGLGGALFASVLSGSVEPGPGPILGLILTVILAVLTYGMAWQLISAGTLKYLAEKTTLGGVLQIRNSINIWQLSWIGVSNLLAQLLTLGLATPWATIRRQRYIVQHLLVTSSVGLERFQDEGAAREDALGEAAADLFGLEIGL